MTTPGPLPFTELTDDKGNVYQVAHFLGQGANGLAVKGKVKSSVTGDPKVGDTVAIKVLTSKEEEAKKKFLAEADNLGTVGDKVGVRIPKPEDADQNLCIIIKYAPGENLRKTIYEINPADLEWKKKPQGPRPPPYLGFNPNMSDKDRLNISLGLLQGLSTMHMLGILHRDIGLDNIKYDPTTGLLKYIDLGESTNTNTTKPAPHAAGAWYLYVPEQSGKPETFQNEAFMIATLIATMYSKDPFELKVYLQRNTLNMNLTEARKLLDDVLGDTQEPPNGMPLGLWKIAQELTDKDVTKRPEGILFCKALDELKDERLIQMRDKILANNQMLLSNAGGDIAKSLKGRDQEQFKTLLNGHEFLQKVALAGKDDKLREIFGRYSQMEDYPEAARNLFKKLSNQKEMTSSELIKALDKELPEIFAAASPTYQFYKEYKEIFEQHKDVAIIRNKINELASKYPSPPDLANFANQKVLELDVFRIKLSREGIKGEKVKESTQCLVQVSELLKNLGRTHGAPRQPGEVIIHSASILPPGLDQDGKRLFMLGEGIRRETQPQKLQEALASVPALLAKEREAHPKEVAAIEGAMKKYHDALEAEKPTVSASASATVPSSTTVERRKSQAP